MRGSGGRTRSTGSLRGDRKKPGGKAAAKGARRLRSGSGAPTSDPRRSAVNRPKSNTATVAAVALSTSSRKSTPKKRPRRHLDRFVPEQRHLFGDDRAVKLPCPGSKR
jgi:hypothetical protein